MNLERIFPPEMETAEFWEELIFDAQAERLLRRIDEGRVEPPRSYSE